MTRLLVLPREPAMLDRTSRLRTQFGELLSLKDVAVLLRYPSLRAIQKARSRGTLEIPFVRITGRRGWFAPVQEVADYLDVIDNIAKLGKPALPPEASKKEKEGGMT